MTEITIPAQPVREQERFIVRRNNFYRQSEEQNSQRLNNKPQNYDSLLEEIKFIETELLAQYGDPI